MNIHHSIYMCKQGASCKSQRGHRPRRSLLALALVGSMFLAPTVAAGQSGDQAPEAKRILLLKTQRHDKVPSLVPTRIFTYVQTMLRLNKGMKILTPDTLDTHKPTQQRLAVQVDDPTLKRAGQALDQAKELVNKQKFMAAQKRFRKSAVLYEKKLALLEDFDAYVDALLGRSIAYFLAGYDDNGEDELARVVTLRPSVILDKRRSPPAAVKALDRIATLYTRAGTGKLVITSNVPGALVYVDGIVKGQAPVTVDGLYRGRHFVRVLAPGYKPLSKPTVVSPGKSTALKVKLKAVRGKKKKVLKPATTEQLLSAAKTGVYDRELLRGMKDLCQKNQLSGILLSYVRKNDTSYELAGFFYDFGQGSVAEMAWVEVDRNLATVQVAAMELSEQVLEATEEFPKTRVSRGVSPIYQEKDPVVVAVVPAKPPVVATTPVKPPVVRPVRPAVVKPIKPVVAVVKPAVVKPAVVKPVKPVVAVVTPGELVEAPKNPKRVGEVKPPTVMRETPPPTVVEPLGRGLTGVQAGHQIDDSDDGSWYEEWWVWTVVGVAAAGTATAVILANGGSDNGASGYTTRATW